MARGRGTTLDASQMSTHDQLASSRFCICISFLTPTYIVLLSLLFRLCIDLRSAKRFCIFVLKYFSVMKLLQNKREMYPIVRLIERLTAFGFWISDRSRWLWGSRSINSTRQIICFILFPSIKFISIRESLLLPQFRLIILNSLYQINKNGIFAQ